MITTVEIGRRRYKCNEAKVSELLSKASKQVRRGVYAIEDKGSHYIQIVNIPMTTTQIKKMRQAYKKRGARVYANI